MHDRETILPLAVGVLVALVLHVALIPLVALGLLRSAAVHEIAQAPPEAEREPDRRPPDGPRDPELGRDNAPLPTAVAWIAHEDFRELIAPKATTHQPALQREVDPVAQASLPDNPTPPAPVAPLRPPAPPVPPVSPEQEQPTEPEEQPAQPTAVALAERTDGELPDAPPDGDVLTQPKPQPQPPTEETEPTPDAPPTEPRPPAETADPAQARPTAAPRAQSESPPTMLNESPLPVRPGSVLTAEGLEIQTAEPNPSHVALLTAIPNNPLARIIFKNTGEVDEVRLTRTTGHVSWDAAVLASLYKWKAVGEKLKTLDHRFGINIELLLRAPRGEDDSKDEAEE